jgi:phage shock protein PspC (stress-responsive transcriptional regulator)
MKDSVAVSLGHRILKVEAAGYASLSAYLEEAARRLHGDPDRTEILADIERAIADRCLNSTSADTPLTAQEIKTALKAVGDIDPASSSGEQPHAAMTRDLAGAMISGVSTAISRRLAVPVWGIRTVWVAAALVSGVAAVALYVILSFALPARAVAYGGRSASVPARVETAIMRARGWLDTQARRLRNRMSRTREGGRWSV